MCGTSLAKSDEIGRRVEQILLSQPEVALGILPGGSGTSLMGSRLTGLRGTATFMASVRP